MSTGSAKKLAGILSRTTGKHEDITDAFDQAMVTAMQRRGILGAVEGMPEEPDDDELRWQRVLNFLREEREAEERRKAEAEAAQAPRPQTTAEMLAAALSNANHSVMPLNGAQVLKAALAGGPGTINGEQA